MARLVDKSLVGVEEQGQMARYRFLETIRQYAHARLQESGEETAMRQRHATVFLEMAEAAEPHLTDAQQARLLERLELELDNVRAALSHMLEQGSGDLAARLSGALYRFWYTRGHLGEGRRWLEAALSLLSAEPQVREPIADTAEQPRMRLRAKTLNRAAVLADEQGDYARATADYEAALALFRQQHDAKGIGTVLNNLGGLAHVQGDNTRARQCFEESIALFQEQGDMWAVAMAFTNLGSVAEAQDDSTSATSYYEQSLALLRTLGDTGASANVLHNLGQVAQAQGDYARARAYFEESLELFRALGDRRGSAYCLEGLGGVEFALGQPVRATRLLSVAYSLRMAIKAPIPPVEQPRYDRLIAAIRAAVDEAVFTTTWQEGSELTVEQLAAAAFSSVDIPDVYHSSVSVM
jgi:non-specific serine/threonine protein kinase